MYSNKIVFEKFEADKIEEYLKHGNIFVVKYTNKYLESPMMGWFQMCTLNWKTLEKGWKFFPESYGSESPFGFNVNEITEIALVDLGE